MGLLCRLFGHSFVLRSIPCFPPTMRTVRCPGLVCRDCFLSEKVCLECLLFGYTEGIGGRQIQCSMGPHKMAIFSGPRRIRTRPRGRLIAVFHE
jgi:hypothetical protein